MEQKQVKQASILPDWAILVVLIGLLLMLFDLGKSDLARVLMRMG